MSRPVLRSRWRLAVCLTALGLLAAAAAPDLASAHGLVGKQDLPIPRWLFAWGASIVLVASFVGLAILWPRPRLEHAPPRHRFTVPVVAEIVCGALGVGAFVAVVYAGMAGTQTATANLAPTVIYVIFWVGIPFLSVLVGDIFALFNPWRAIGRATGWLMRRSGAGASEPMAYPAWLGRWPAVAGVLAFAWVELVYVNRDDPSILATMALAYAAIQLVGMSLFGVERWSRHGDAYGVYFRMFSLVSPVRWDGRRVDTRAPLSGATWLNPVPGTVALLCTMIGTTSFDGLSQGQIWTGPNGIAPRLQDSLIKLGFSQETALEIAFTIGLAAMVALISGLYRLGVIGMRSVDRDHLPAALARRFVHSLVPIAIAYVVAHYFSLLMYQGQAMAYLVSDPLGNGSDLFGTAARTIDYSLVSATGVWYVQVGALVLGHVAGLALAHDRALVVYDDDPRDATRSQYWMLAVMVAFTSLGLWLLSAAAQ